MLGVMTKCFLKFDVYASVRLAEAVHRPVLHCLGHTPPAHESRYV